jgi:hypothetical protein
MTSRFGDLPDLYTFECLACGVSHIEPALVAAKLDATEDHQAHQKSSSGLVPLLGRLDAIEGNRLFRTSRKRLRQTFTSRHQVYPARQSRPPEFGGLFLSNSGCIDALTECRILA